MVNSASVVWDCFKKVLPTENSNIFLVHHSDFLHSIFYNSSLPYTYALKAAFNHSGLIYSLCFLSVSEESQFKSVSFTFLTSVVNFNSYIIFPAQVSFTLLFFTLNNITLQCVIIYI